MPDPFTVWLSDVDQQLHLVASISFSLATIFGSANAMLGSVLGMYVRIQNFRRGLKAAPASRRKPAAKGSPKKRSNRGRNVST